MDYASLPIKDAIAVPPMGLSGKLPKLVIGAAWQRWLSGLKGQVDAKPTRTATVTLTLQDASIPVTPLPIPDVTGGIWRVSTTVRVTRASGGGSAIQVTLAWTERAVGQTEPGTNLLGNLTTTREGRTAIIRSDAEQPISFSTVYASAGVPTMQYSLDIVAELLFADPEA